MTTDMTMEQRQQNEILTTWPLRRVGLRVQDMDLCIDYYTRLGFSIIRDERKQENGSVGLGVGTREILQLRPLEAGRPGLRARQGSIISHCW